MLAMNETARMLAELAAEQATIEALRKRAMKSIAGTPRWYLAHASAHEKQAVAEFERSEIEFYYPKTWGIERVPKRDLPRNNRGAHLVRPVKVALWRKYFFVHIDLRAHAWREAFERAHIHGIFANNEGGRLLPAPAPEELVMSLKRLEVDGAIPSNTTVIEILLTAGDRVQITKGPFTEGVIHADVEKPIGGLDESAKAKVAIQLLGRTCVFEVPIRDIEKL